MRRRNYGEDIAGPTWLYRLYSGTALAYVRVSNDPKYRFEIHRRKKVWWSSVDHVDLVWFPSRSEAFAAERIAIRSENPIHNIARPKAVLS